jgi:hypothetical protein
MSKQTRIMTALLAIGLSASCRGAKTDKPVATDANGNTTVSPSGDAAAKEGKSMVRLVNALPNSKAIDVSGDDQALFTAVGYKTVTPYVEVENNQVNFKLHAATKDSTLADNSEMMADGNRYTIVALPDDKGGATMRILRDEIVPDSGKARVRVINAAPGVKDVDVALQGQKDALFEDVDYATEAGYKDITPVTATVEIRREDPKGKTILVKDVHFEPGKAYTIVLTGSKTNPVEVITFEDTETGGSGLSLR